MVNFLMDTARDGVSLTLHLRSCAASGGGGDASLVLEPGDAVAMARISNSKGVLEIMPIKDQPSEARRE